MLFSFSKRNCIKSIRFSYSMVKFEKRFGESKNLCGQDDLFSSSFIFQLWLALIIIQVYISWPKNQSSHFLRNFWRSIWIWLCNCLLMSGFRDIRTWLVAQYPYLPMTVRTVPLCCLHWLDNPDPVLTCWIDFYIAFNGLIYVYLSLPGRAVH